MQQGAAAAAAALCDLPSASAAADAGDAVMARWLQSAGLQHLASPSSSASSADHHRLLPNMLMQGYGPQTAEEKQKIFRLLRNLNFGSELVSEPYTPTAQNVGGGSAMDGFYSPDIRGDLGAGLLDLHAIDDTELLSEHVVSEPFEPSPFMPSRGFDGDFDALSGGQQQEQANSFVKSSTGEKETTAKETNVAKIKVVVRKRPLNKKELQRKEEDIVTVHDGACLTVHEPKLKVDLTAYVEKHEFYFDAVLNEHVTNDEVYRITVEPIVPTIFQRGKATCFAYGQTGSGKTFTMQPLPLRAAEDIMRLLHKPAYHNQKFKLWLSYFEIYGGKLFDLLSDRRKLLMREDGRQHVCIVGLQEFEVSDVLSVREFIEKGNTARSTGSTGANEESSRSHAILQLAIKKHNEIKDTRRQSDLKELKAGKLVGKISFIDLAGSERGADTTDNDRQTRIEGAEINKSLLALKECIRALDNDQIHIPFRGSKLTEVLRDSFVGNSRTVMISCISPNAGSCEHTLNTLRYADRVKSLSKSGNPRKDQNSVSQASVNELSSSSFPFSVESEDFYEKSQESKATEASRKNPENISYISAFDVDRHSSSIMPNYIFNGREESGSMLPLFEKEKNKLKNEYDGASGHKSNSSTQNSFSAQDEEKAPKVSPPPSKIPKVSEKQNILSRRDNAAELHSTSYEQLHYGSSLQNVSTRQYEEETVSPNGEINLLLEEQVALVAAHRKEIENTMEIVREEMNLLTEVDRPGSLIDNYVTQLSFVLSKKAAGLTSLQARLARFQHRVKEQELFSRKKAPR